MFRFVVVALFAAAAATSAARAQDKMQVAVWGAHPILFFVDDAGAPAGFNADIARALCERLAAQCRIVAAKSAAAAVEGLLAGQHRLVLAGLPTAGKPPAGVAMSARYYKNGAKFARAKGAKGRISYKGLAGKAVGAQKGGVIDRFLTAEFDGVEIRRYDNAAALYAALQQGEVDLALADMLQQAAFAAKNKGFVLAGATYRKAPYFAGAGVAAREEDAELLQRVNEAIAKIRADGAYKAINKKYARFSFYGR